MILNPFPLALPYTAHLGLLSAPFRRDLPKIPTDIPRSKLIHLQGYCQSFTHSKKGHLKSLKLQVGPDQLTLKIPKLLGHSFSHQFVFGQPLRIIAKRGKKSLKAMFILPVEHFGSNTPAIAPVPPQPRPTSQSRSIPQPVQIQVCSKGNCKKRGSCQFAQEIEQQIRRSGLESQIQVQMTDCLKQCKQAPNLKLKPQGQIFSQVKSQDIPRLLDRCLVP